MEQATHYTILGVPPGASADEVRSAYASRVRELRAQLQRGERCAPEFLDALRCAYVTLSDPAARRAYDAELGFSTAVKDALPIPQEAPAGEPRRYGFRFAGNGGEYFRIWIVNLFLSVLTLGIYSAWAKVRREKYFHRNLLLDDSGFDYHGDPKAILKGRVIAFGLFMLLSVAQHNPYAYLVAWLVLLPLIPWLAVRAFRFRAANTSYRGLRFSFHGTYREALVVFVGYALLASLTLGLMFPAWLRRQKKFVLDNLSYANARFSCAVSTRGFYRVFAVSLLIVAAVAVAAAVPAAAVSQPLSPGKGTVFPLVYMAFLVPAFLLMQLLTGSYVQVAMANLLWNSVTVDGHRFESRLKYLGYLAVAFSNWLLTLLSLGLFWPWARVRLARYRAGHLAVNAASPLESFVGVQAQRASAVGDEAAEMFDMDVAL